MMQSSKHIAYRVLQLVFTITFLVLVAGLISQNGPYAAVPKILRWIEILGCFGILCALIGFIPAMASTTSLPWIPVILDIIMAGTFLTTAIVLATRVGVKSCGIGHPKWLKGAIPFMRYPDTSRFWTPTIVMGHAGDGYVHPHQWGKRCHMNKAIYAFLLLGSLTFIASAIFGVSRYIQQISNPEASVTRRQAKDDLVVVPEIKEVA